MINKVSFAIPNYTGNKIGFKGEKEVQDLVKKANGTKLNHLGIFCDKVERQLEKNEITPEDVDAAAEKVTNKLVQKGLRETVRGYREYISKSS
ncbi:MAG TPA: hypothetical protein P5556_00865 [Candidatus Gastranaerophilales bacterium]|nr:hypothetical protein [Candidatus Gastranaerophilales bacterium]